MGTGVDRSVNSPSGRVGGGSLSLAPFSYPGLFLFICPDLSSSSLGLEVSGLQLLFPSGITASRWVLILVLCFDMFWFILFTVDSMRNIF